MTTHLHTSTGAAIHGDVDGGYGPVMDAFRANFEDRGDLGAGCTVYADGRLVVDLWGGTADRRTWTPWAHDTAAVIFSCTKGVLAICAYQLVQDGRLCLDEPIATYWPEFAHAGKAATTVRDALSHRSGLPALERDLTAADVLGWDAVIAAIEEQRPLFRPSDGYFYHAMTYGWVLGEVIRRVTGRTPGEYLRQRLAEPLGLAMWIGLPADRRASVAWMEPPLPDPDTEQARAAAAVIAANPLIERSLTMAAYPFPASGGLVSFNDPALQAAEIPGANGISTAWSLARLYAACVSEVDGVGPLLTAASLDDAMVVRSAGPQLSGMPDDGGRWGSGFQVASPPFTPMLGPGSLGHAGAGGQLGFADREHRVGFAYLSNQMGGYGDARATALTEALGRVLRG